MTRYAVFVGDSFTAGQGDPEGRGWVGRIAEAAERRGDPLAVVNLGVGGATSEQVALHWERAAREFVPDGAEVRLVVGVGANDTTALGGGRTWVAPPDSERALARILDRARDLGWPAFVLGPGPACQPAQDARSADLEDAFAAICADRGVPFVPILVALLDDPAWTGEALGHDGLHPGAGGYARLATLVTTAGLLDWLTT